MRSPLLVFAAAAVAATVYAPPASACGGCFPPQGENESIVTDHRMVLSVSPAQSTLYDQIQYRGSPSEFAWVLPISGTVDVGISADSLFAGLDNLTSVIVEAPPTNCPGPPESCFSNSEDSAGEASPTACCADGGALTVPGVTVVKTEVVGPYETVQLHPTTNTDVTALEGWLADHDFNISDDIKPVIAKYVSESFNFLALRLKPGAGVQSMRPVRVTTKGANVALPLRMVAAGTGATVGITLWVVGSGRYEPTNFQSYALKDEDITWDWATSTSNYKDLRTAKEATSPGKLWEIESSISTFAGQIRSSAQIVSSANAPPRTTGTGTGSNNDYLDVTDADGGVTTPAGKAQTDDYDTLFAGLTTGPEDFGTQVHITRMRADLARAALASDMTIGAASDQTDINRARIPKIENGQPLCPVYTDCNATGKSLPRDQVPSSSSGGPAGSDSSCRTTAPRSNAPLSVALGFLAIAVGRSFRRRRQPPC